MRGMSRTWSAAHATCRQSLCERLIEVAFGSNNASDQPVPLCGKYANVGRPSKSAEMERMPQQRHPARPIPLRCVYTRPFSTNACKTVGEPDS